MGIEKSKEVIRTKGEEAKEMKSLLEATRADEEALEAVLRKMDSNCTEETRRAVETTRTNITNEMNNHVEKDITSPSGEIFQEANTEKTEVEGEKTSDNATLEGLNSLSADTIDIDASEAINEVEKVQKERDENISGLSDILAQIEDIIGSAKTIHID